MRLRALIILHPGFEEMEATAPIDLLSRAGVEIVQASASSNLNIEGRSGIKIEADSLLRDVLDQDFDLVVLPGGPGIMKLRKDDLICKCLRKQHAERKFIACICAAPLLLLDAGLSADIAYTAHPSTIEELRKPSNQPVVIDSKIITSRGAGTATEFALALVEALTGRESAIEIADSICWPHKDCTITS